MASPYTSAVNGKADASDADTWGQGIGVYPNTTNDVVNIGHTVTWNLNLDPATVALGQVTVTSGGILVPDKTMNTCLPLGGNRTLRINTGGSLLWGTTGSVIPKAYTSKILWNPSASGGGWDIQPGAIVDIYADPTYYGSNRYAYLYQDWVAPASGDDTLYLDADLTAWPVGGVFFVHKGGTFAHVTNDFCTVLIRDTITWDGTKSTVPVTIVHIPGGAATFLLGGYCGFLSSNVEVGMYGYNTDIGNYNTTNPPGMLTNGLAFGAGRFYAQDVAFRGMSQIYQLGKGDAVFTRCVARNGGGVLGGYYPQFLQGIIFSCSTANSAYKATIDAWIASINSANGALISCMNSYMTGAIFGANAFYGGLDNELENVDIFSYQHLVRANTYPTARLNNCRIGFRRDGIAASGTSLSNNVTGRIILSMNNCKVPAADIYGSLANRNVRGTYYRITSENHDQVLGAFKDYDAFGDIVKVAADGASGRPTQRQGGSADLLEVTTQTNCDSYDPVRFFYTRHRLLAGTYNIKVYTQTDWATLTADKIKLYAEFLDEVSGGHLDTEVSSEGIATRKGTINNGEDAVNKGGGLVGIPATAHGCSPGDSITISNTVAYNDTYTVHADTTENEIVITETFASETFGADDVFDNLSKWTQYLSCQITTTQDGLVNLYLDLMGSSGTAKVWVDVLPVITRV